MVILNVSPLSPARLMSFICEHFFFIAQGGTLIFASAHARFLHLHGREGARLDRDHSVHGQKLHKPSFLNTLCSLVLFLAPEVHLAELESLWVDNIVNHVPWKRFIRKLQAEWQEFILHVRRVTLIETPRLIAALESLPCCSMRTLHSCPCPMSSTTTIIIMAQSVPSRSEWPRRRLRSSPAASPSWPASGVLSWACC